MYKIGIFVICLLLFLLGLFYFAPGLKDAMFSTRSSDSHFTTWKEFIPQSGLFKVLLPNPPQYAKDFVNLPDSDKKRRYDMYASEKIDGTLFLVNVITYPPEVDASLTEDVLRQTVEELMRDKPDNQLAKIENSLYKSRPTLDFNFNNRDFHVEGKVLMEGSRVYVLSYVTRLHEFDPAEYSHFIDSFELMGTKKE